MNRLITYLFLLTGFAPLMTSCLGDDDVFVNPIENRTAPSWLSVEMKLTEKDASTASGELLVSGFKNAKGGMTVTSVGFCYGTDSIPTIENNRLFEDDHYYCFTNSGENDNNDEFFVYDRKTGLVSDKYPFSHGSLTYYWNIKGLKPGTEYFCRTFAINAAGVAYGNVVTIRTETLQ